MIIRVRAQHLVNCGNFDNVNPMVEVEDECREGESAEDTHARLSQIAHKLWNIELRQHIDEHLITRQKVSNAIAPVAR